MSPSQREGNQDRTLQIELKHIERDIVDRLLAKHESEPFWYLPNGEEGVEYIKTIKEPVTLLQIKSRIATGQYKSPREPFHDLFTLISNGNHFYHPLRNEYKATVAIEEFIFKQLQKREYNFLLKYPIGELRKPC